MAGGSATLGMSELDRLTTRQLEVLAHLSRPGATQRSVADDLGISTQTVKNHLQVVYRVLGVRTAAQAIWRARRVLSRTGGR